MGIASVAMAGIPDLTLSTATTAAASQVSVYTLPNGLGKGLDEAKSAGSTTPVNATITLTLLDGNGDPIFLYPAEDMWLATSLGNLAVCPGGSAADASTNASGITTFSNPLFGGKQSNKVGLEKCVVIISGSPLNGSQLDILFNSPDIDGNLAVNLSDTVLYAQNATGSYSYRSDFFFDNVINLSDTVLYAQGLGAVCP
jgi:hypothetical protein